MRNPPASIAFSTTYEWHLPCIGKRASDVYMQTSHSTSSRALSFAEFRTLALASLGGALEFYDFVIFVFFAAVIGKLFFSAGLPDWMRELQTFGIFAAGYLARPLGGVVIVHFGDIHGRRKQRPNRFLEHLYS